MSEFLSVTTDAFSSNPFTAIGKEWMLITSANKSGETCGKDYNMMTASWGGMGVLWGKNVVFLFIRPQRHTFTFVENNEPVTLSFFPEEYRSALAFCGRESGRDCDKAASCSLTPVFSMTDAGRAVWFHEASVVIKAKKMYASPILESAMLDPSIMTHYPERDFHMMYVCEITEILMKQP